jgi:chromosomal replication initiation ATPase DnaA
MNVQTIISDAAALYGITTADMTSPCRRRDMADARIVASYIAHKRLGVTKSEIARRLHRTHADIIHLIRAAEEWISQQYLNPRGANNIVELLNRYFDEPGRSRESDKTEERRAAARQGMARVAL